METLRDFMRELKNPGLAFAVACMLAIIILFFLLPIGSLRAHDHDHPELDEWYATLMQPDAPQVSCCGKADAYWCDDYYARDGKAYCKITDDRDDRPLSRPHIPVGTEIEVPTNKLKWDKSNPTGHAVIFVRGGSWDPSTFTVFCFVQSSGS
jgi:hypothetical protein